MIRTLALLLLAAAPVAASAEAAPAPAAAHERLWLGSAWYPEQWPEERWDTDLSLMEKAGANVVRVGEFAWARMEPSEGRYDLDWLERAVRAAERHHIKVVIGTPTDTPPNWMTTRYPEVMKIASDGTPTGLGGRRQFSISSPLYRDFCRKIVAELAKRFGRDPNVIGWQIGNEYTDESYDPAARAAWHGWLQRKYGTLDTLNDAWTTAYWSQTYSAWDQVPFTDKPGNPGWMMDEKRFITDQWIAFQKNQVDALRAAIDPRQFVTTNLGGLGWADRFDRYAINRDLDLASWDDYVGTGHLKPDRNGATHDLVRGWKRRNFWVMEAQPGFVNWSPDNNILSPGETRAMAWQAIGHGADAMLYWQWRSALNGQEQYHGAIVGPDGTPLPFYDEFAEVGRDFAKASAALAGTAPVSRVAILQDYPSRWASDFQPHTKDYDPIEVLLDTYRPLKDRLGAVDIVAASDDLDRYALVFAPSLNVIPQALADRLAAYVRGGGHLVLGPRAGMKDAFNRLAVQRQPGPLADILGGRVEQFYALDDKDHVEVSGSAGSG
ncbi:MAG TPA: beta-galactosidase, partial [Sphingomonas sp.]